jgi:DNA polymerase-1
MGVQLVMDLDNVKTLEVAGHLARSLQPSDLWDINGGVVAIDVETTGLLWDRDEPVGLGIWCPARDICGYLTQDKLREAIQVMKAWEPGTTVIGHNLKFDLHFLGISPRDESGQLRWRILDTTVMVHLFDSRLRKGLELCEQTFFAEDSKAQYLHSVPKKSQGSMAGWPPAVLAAYCANDCRVTYNLAQELWPKLREMGLLELMGEQMEYLAFLWDVERHGLPMNLEILVETRKYLAEQRATLERALLTQLRLPNLDWRSPEALSHALYDHYGWERPKNPFLNEQGVDVSRTKEKGKYNKTMTSGFVLAEKAKHPLAPIVLTLRETDTLDKLANSYQELVGADGFIHPSFNLTGTRSGRISASRPNVQNIPGEWRSRAGIAAFENLLETSMGGAIDDLTHREQRLNLRLAFAAPPGYTMLSIDYKQMEMRMFGILAQEPYMLSSLAAGRDIHSEICRAVWGTVDEMRREWSKAITFGLIYGMSMGSVQFKLNMTPEEAHKLAQDYWDTFPRIKPWLKEVVLTCKRNKFLRYWSGRIWREDNPDLMYVGVNALIQGGCADLLSVAALRCDKVLREYGAGQVINLIHDELLFLLPTETLPELVPKLREAMMVPDLLDLPFFTDPKTGPSYGDMHEWEG